MTYQIVKGMKDIRDEDLLYWRQFEIKARKVMESFCFNEIRTPILELTELFQKGTGDTTDIVQKEMYTFTDKGGRSVTMRPEGTPPVVRSLLENSEDRIGGVYKYFYYGPMFRYEKPQKGRLRQFHQLGVEIFGLATAFSDAEVIDSIVKLCHELGIRDYRLFINSLGCDECRPKFKEELISYLTKTKDKLCKQCQERFETNPLRVFDCKNETCQKLIKDAPSILDFLCNVCNDHFTCLKTTLENLKINFEVNHKIVRGLDYYSRTVFEFVSDALGSQNAFVGGGRYDRLISDLGGKPMPAVGFGMGVERIIEIMKSKGINPASGKKIFISNTNLETKKKSFDLASILRANGLSTYVNLQDKSLKAQFKTADKNGFNLVLVIGEDELAESQITVKNLTNGEQQKVKQAGIITYIKEWQKT
ncbi:MAG: histidine--tRNA ligase [Pseudomonadota bacterium]